MYSTTSTTALEICKAIGAKPDIHFVEAMRRGGRIYVRPTAAKPDEARWLRARCQEHGYIYAG